MRRHERRPRDQRRVARQQAGDRVNRRHLQRLALASAAAAAPEVVAPAWFCRLRAARSASGCEHRPPRPPPRIGHASGRPRRRGRRPAACADGGASILLSSCALPSIHDCSWPSVRAPHTSMPSTRLASARLSTGTTTAGQPSRLAASTAGSTPLTGRTRPSSANSPSSTVFSSRAHSVLPLRRQHGQRQSDVVHRAHLRQRRRRQRQRQPGHRPAVAAVGDRRADTVTRLPQCRVGQADQVHTRQTRGDVRLDLHDLAVEPADGHRKRSTQRHQPTPRRWVISGADRRADPHADDVDAHLRPAAVLPGQPQPGQPPQPAHLLRRDSLRDAAELVAGAGLHLNEHHDARRVVGRDHVELAVSAPPVAGQHPQPQRLQVIDRELFSQRADLGTGQRSHDHTVRFGADKPWRSAHAHPQLRIHPQPRPNWFRGRQKPGIRSHRQ